MGCCRDTASTWATEEPQAETFHGYLNWNNVLIERRDRVINVCEMKFSINEYVIDKDYDMVLRNKLDAFRRMTNCKKSLQTTMITTYGVKRGKYSGIINSQITLEDLFQ